MPHSHVAAQDAQDVCPDVGTHEEVQGQEGKGQVLACSAAPPSAGKEKCGGREIQQVAGLSCSKGTRR